MYLVGLSPLKRILCCCKTAKIKEFLDHYREKKKKLKEDLDLKNWIQVLNLRQASSRKESFVVADEDARIGRVETSPHFDEGKQMYHGQPQI